MKKSSFWQRIKFHWLLLNVPLSQLLPYMDFLQEEPTVYHFPKIKGLKGPNARMGNITIKQFSIADTLFYDFIRTKDIIKLRQLVAALYCLGKFDEELLPEVAEITDKQDVEVWYRILLAYTSCRNYITRSYQKIFPPEKKIPEDVIVPVFKKSDKSYTPFNEVIITLSFEDPQPLGSYAEAKETKIYEFLNVFTKAIIRHEKEEQNAKRK